MSVQIGGAVSGVGADVDSATRAIRATPRGNDPGSLGSYRKALVSGVVSAGAGAGLLSYAFRWAPTPNTAVCVLRRIGVSVGELATATAGFVAINAFFARPYTTLDGTAGNAGTFTTNNAKKRTSYPVSAGVTCAILTAGNTTPLSGGSSTLDTDPFATITNSLVTVTGTPIVSNQELYRPAPGDYPIVFANNEGFVIKVTVPAGATWTLGVDVDWDEFASF